MPKRSIGKLSDAVGISKSGFEGVYCAFSQVACLSLLCCPRSVASGAGWELQNGELEG